jgi:type II secretory pathway component PulC
VRDGLGILIAGLLLTIAAGEACFAEDAPRDPTRPYSASVPGTTATASYRVNAIIISDDRRVAIVNGKRVGIGSAVHDATVIAIEKDHLILQRNGQYITARLKDGAPRR